MKSSFQLIGRVSLLSVFISFLPAMFAANGPPADPSRPTTPVTVENEVTVKGQVSVQGPVGVQGSVVVTNPETAPVQVQDVDNPAFQPFQKTFILNMPDGASSASSTLAIPAGKR